MNRDELLLSVHIPALAAGARSIYLKAMERKIWAFTLVSVAAVVTMSEEKVEDARLVLGGVAPIPWRASAAEQALIGAEPTEERLAQATSLALDGAEPLSHNGYKVPLAQNLIRRALTSLV